ncbi:MAG: DNA-primase RepB domain-containing protein [Gammaproteobacteria bacterium]
MTDRTTKEAMLFFDSVVGPEGNLRFRWGSHSTDGRWRPWNGMDDIWNRKTLLTRIPFLKAKNLAGCSIFAGPINHGECLYIDADDASELPRVESLGIEPLATIQTSPGHAQVWLPSLPNHSDQDTSRAITAALKADAGAHSSSTEKHPRIGRVPGFTNRKPMYKNTHGQHPFAIVLQTGTPALKSIGILSSLVTQYLESQGAAGGRPEKNHHSRKAKTTQQGATTGQSEADMSKAVYMAARGSSESDISQWILENSPNLPNRHSDPKDYAKRTAQAAISWIGSNRK